MRHLRSTRCSVVLRRKQLLLEIEEIIKKEKTELEHWQKQSQNRVQRFENEVSRIAEQMRRRAERSMHRSQDLMNRSDSAVLAMMLSAVEEATAGIGEPPEERPRDDAQSAGTGPASFRSALQDPDQEH